MLEPRFSESDVSAALGGQVNLLGVGATADTWKLNDSAVKIICDASYPAERLEREVTGLGRAKSSHVVQLLEVGQLALNGETHAYLRCEYIEGGDVLGRFDSGQWPSEEEGIVFLRGLLIGAAALHDAKVLHRDIKPGNIALRNGVWSEPVLLDLGLARVLDQESITYYPRQMGTHLYMSPEQLLGQRAVKASDLFAIGVTVRQGIGRAHPFYDDGVRYSYDEAVKRIEAGPKSLPGTLPPGIISLLDRLVSPVQNERGSTGSSLRRLVLADDGGSDR